ncbi:MAG TPA: hypothetical protein VGS97_24305, partial [Actinocrinis sp.]
MPVEQDGDLISYAPSCPQDTMTVVDIHDWRTTVAHGATGQVRLTVLHEDQFTPNIFERDQAVRYDVDRR